MGRGRQKAKQTKVARRLKYFSPDTDYDALQRELSSTPDGQDSYAGDDTSEDLDEVDDEEDDEYADWSPGRRH